MDLQCSNIKLFFFKKKKSNPYFYFDFVIFFLNFIIIFLLKVVWIIFVPIKLIISCWDNSHEF